MAQSCGTKTVKSPTAWEGIFDHVMSFVLPRRPSSNSNFRRLASKLQTFLLHPRCYAIYTFSLTGLVSPLILRLKTRESLKTLSADGHTYIVHTRHTLCTALAGLDHVYDGNVTVYRLY